MLIFLELWSFFYIGNCRINFLTGINRMYPRYLYPIEDELPIPDYLEVGIPKEKKKKRKTVKKKQKKRRTKRKT